MPRLRGIIAAMLLAGAASAAEEPDLLVFRDGLEITCRIITQDAETVVIEVEGIRVEFERQRISRIGRSSERPRPAEPVRAEPRRPAPPASDGASPWRLSAGLSVGWVVGSVTSHGSLADSVAATIYPLDGDFSLDGAAFLPGAWLRILRGEARAEEWAPVGGLQLGYGSTSGSDASYGQTSACLLGGIAWRAGTLQVQTLAKAGYAGATFARTLQLAAGAGTEEIDDSADLTGWTAGVELTAIHRLGGWDASVALGLDHSRLAGDASWTSPSGRFAAEEELDARFTAAYAAISLGRSW